MDLKRNKDHVFRKKSKALFMRVARAGVLTMFSLLAMAEERSGCAAVVDGPKTECLDEVHRGLQPGDPRICGPKVSEVDQYY